MVNYTMTIYSDPADVKTAVDAVVNTATLIVQPFMEKGKQKFLVIV